MDAAIDSQTLALIEEHVRQLLNKMSFTDAAISCSCSTEAMSSDGPAAHLRVEIQSGDTGRLLIGSGGEHLLALQHIVRCVLHRCIEQRAYITVDVNGYEARRQQNLAYLAEEEAKKAIRTGRTIVLQPMRAHDRRSVHTALANRSDVRTESLGEEPNRRIVIRPVFL